MKPDNIFPVFMILWAILGVSLFLMFHLNKNVPFKRKYFPVAMMFIGIVFAGFVTLLMPTPLGILIAYPAIILITYMNIRLTKFCGKCGATNYNRMLFTAMNYCQRCGEPFERSK